MGVVTSKKRAINIDAELEARKFAEKYSTKGIPMRRKGKQELPWGTLMRNAYVAVLDILGFKDAIASHGSIGGLQQLGVSVKGALTRAGHRGMYKALFPRSTDKVIKRVRKAQESLESYLFSDTIVFVMPCMSQDSYEAWAFIEAVSGAADAMFKAGFPARGCVDFGDVLRSDKGNFVLGVPFLNAYTIGESLRFAGIAISAVGVKQIRKTCKDLRRFGISRMQGMVKGFGGKPAQKWLYCLDYFRLNNSCDDIQELRNRCKDYFCMHGKSCSSASVKLILDNTLKMIDFMKTRG